eukprot:c16032_g1_i1.p1 GENE.c16032_g1_i1~~c16032_g1_i1.p1  ORF type:complete len:549 (+),score=142.00 c16032_g1_i1:1-1647(+)
MGNVQSITFSIMKEGDADVLRATECQSNVHIGDVTPSFRSNRCIFISNFQYVDATGVVRKHLEAFDACGSETILLTPQIVEANSLFDRKQLALDTQVTNGTQMVATQISSSQQQIDSTVESIAISIGLSLQNLHLSLCLDNSPPFCTIDATGVDVQQVQSTHEIASSLSVQSLTVLNQDSKCRFPTVFGPVISSPAPPSFRAQNRAQQDVISSPIPDLISLSVCREPTTRDNRVPIFTSVNFGLAPIQVGIEQQFISNLVLFAEGLRDTEKSWDDGEWLEPAAPKGTKVFIGSLTIRPIKLVLSFSGVEVTFRGLGQALSAVLLVMSQVANLNINLQQVVISDQLLSIPEFQNLLYVSYTRMLLNVPQVLAVVGSMDALGNPQQFFKGIKAGVSDFIREPMEGLRSGSVLEVGQGLFRGAESLVSNAVGGVGAGVSKISKGVGNTVAALTFDDDFIEQRDTKVERRPSSAFEGVKQGGDQIVSGVLGGVKGLVSHGKEGIESGNLTGLARNLGMGVVGLVVKPVSGLADAVSSTSKGIQEQIQRKDEK